METGYRRTELVGCVGDELAHPLFGTAGGVFGAFEGVEHLVEGGGGSAEFGVGAGRLQASASATGGDGTGEGSHRVERGQGEAHAEDEGEGGDQECRGAGEEEDPAEGAAGAVEQGGVGGEDQGGAAGALTGLQGCANLADLAGRLDRWGAELLAGPEGERDSDAVGVDSADEVGGGDVLPGQLLGELGAAVEQGVEVAFGLGVENLLHRETGDRQDEKQDNQCGRRHPASQRHRPQLLSRRLESRQRDGRFRGLRRT